MWGLLFTLLSPNFLSCERKSAQPNSFPLFPRKPMSLAYFLAHVALVWTALVWVFHSIAWFESWRIREHAKSWVARGKKGARKKQETRRSAGEEASRNENGNDDGDAEDEGDGLMLICKFEGCGGACKCVCTCSRHTHTHTFTHTHTHTHTHTLSLSLSLSLSTLWLS